MLGDKGISLINLKPTFPVGERCGCANCSLCVSSRNDNGFFPNCNLNNIYFATKTLSNLLTDVIFSSKLKISRLLLTAWHGICPLSIFLSHILQIYYESSKFLYLHLLRITQMNQSMPYNPAISSDLSVQPYVLKFSYGFHYSLNGLAYIFS